MVRRTNPPPVPQPAVLNAEDIRQGVERLQRRLEALKQFDPNTVIEEFETPGLNALAASIDDALVRTFGSTSIEYERYRPATEFSYNLSIGLGPRPIEEARKDLAHFRSRSLALLEQAINSLEERRSELESRRPLSFMEQIREGRERATQQYAELSSAPDVPLSKKVFVVHGHAGEPKEAVARFLGTLGLDAVILHEQANGGRTIIEKFEKNADDAGFAVVLLTPDDVGGKKQGLVASMLKPRARQNVVFELGYFIGKLGRSHVCALKLGDVEEPSDISGVVYVPYDGSGAWKTALGRELEEAGYEIDWNSVMRGGQR
jgi:predicted nucleotide-binding protein